MVDDKALFLRELWQPSEKDYSFFDYWDVEGTKARKEVMAHIIKMMASVPCPKESEKSSNLYKILVKKLRGHISTFDDDSEVVETATKKVAKWVENVVKEAYYRKQGRIKPRKEAKPEIKKKIRFEPVYQESSEENEKIREPKRSAKIKTGRKPSTSKRKSQEKVKAAPKRTVQEPETQSLGEKHLEKTPAKSRDTEKETVAQCVIIDGKKYVLKKEESEEENEEPFQSGSRNVDIKMKNKPAKSKIGKELPKKTTREKVARVKHSTDESDSDEPSTMIKSSTVPSSRLIVDKNQRVVLVKPIKSPQVSNVVQIPKKEKRELITNEKEQVKAKKSNASISASDTESMASMDKSGTPLVRNWSNWILNITKRARSAIKWEGSNTDQFSSGGNDFKIRNENDESGIQEKLDKITKTTNEFQVPLEYDRTEQVKSKNVDQTKAKKTESDSEGLDTASSGGILKYFRGAK